MSEARQPITYGTVCSGIEAPSSAVDPLGWVPLWFSEIEPFPKAVLAHHYPHVPDLGDMTALPARILAGEVPAPDVFIGGTPCQSFSVAGLRRGLADPRGQLTRTFVEILDALDTVRTAAGKPPAVALWENVPGVLSDRDNAFGNFLAALVGEDDALLPPGGRWSNAGYVFGPQRIAAWRVLDAQYFGVAQRRRRVFVVVGARTGNVYPPKVLLVEEGVRRDTPPSREAGQGTPAFAAPCATGGGGGRGAGSDDGGRGGGVVVAPPLTATNDPSRSPQSAEVTAQVEAVLRAQYPEVLPVVGTLSDGAHNGGGLTDRTPTPGASYPSRYPELPEVAWCLQHRDAKGADSDTKPGHVIPVQTAGGFFDAGVCVTGDRTHALKAEGADGSEDGTGRGTPIVPALSVALRGRDGGATAELGGEQAGTLRASTGGGDKPHVLTAMSVRRLTPTECERLQGFPDGHTLIPWKGKPAAYCPDGPRYKALGNSMAVPVVRWIARRIDASVRR